MGDDQPIHCRARWNRLIAHVHRKVAASIRLSLPTVPLLNRRLLTTTLPAPYSCCCAAPTCRQGLQPPPVLILPQLFGGQGLYRPLDDGFVIVGHLPCGGSMASQQMSSMKASKRGRLHAEGAAELACHCKGMVGQ